MKIRKIEIENINSIKGHWCIDFTHPDYKKNHDLFVICGETGAGKTTLLDAVTLALYGRTPRQGSIVSDNEVMTRHTARCMARVTYECKKGIFTSEFLQTKPRGKIDAAVSAPSCQIIDETTNEVYPKLSVTKLATKNAEIIQLNYDQFCRSIMLAQGEFDKFISSKPDERSDILAKLNGTEKYKQIAKAVWEKGGLVSKEFERVKDRKDFICNQLLSEEKVESLKTEKNQLLINGKKLENEINEILTAMNWLEKKLLAEKKLADAEKARKKFEDEENRFNEKKKVLEKAEKTKNCGEEYSRLCDVRNDLKNEKENLENLAGKKNQVLGKHELLTKSFERAKSDWEKENAKSDEYNKLWSEINVLDSKIEAQKNNLEDLKRQKNEAEKVYDENRKIKTESEEKKDRLCQKIEGLKKYLEDNKKDEDLSSIITLFKSNKKQILENQKEISSSKKGKSDAENNLKEKQRLLDETNSENKKINSELEKLVSQEFISISRLIRNQLKSGLPCPVCGSKNHPSCENDEKSENESYEKNDVKSGNSANQTGLNEGNESKELKVAADVSDLHKKLEDTEKRLSELQQKVFGYEKEIENCNDRINEASEKNKTILAEMNDAVLPWSVKFEDAGDEKISVKIEEKIQDFSEKSKLYAEYSKDFIEKKEELVQTDAVIASINIEKLENDFAEKKTKFDNLQKQFLELKNSRTNLFGEKNVEEANEKYKSELKRLETSKNQKEKEKNDCNTELITLEGNIISSQKALEEKKVSMEKLEEDFFAALKKNGFESEDEFVKCRLDSNQFDELKKMHESLKIRDTETQTNLTNAQNDLNEICKMDVTSETKENLANKKQKKSEEINVANNRLGQIDSELKQNEQRIEESRAILDEYNEKLEKKTLWDELKKIVGKSTGETLQSFVQALAFKRLITKANHYVRSISGKYSLVQKDGEVDFLIHDVNYPDSKEDRPITNMSGGEKFIISLSLALGIAELASENVRVDSLFLDEGFGTLSGNPLTEAVNALKQLQNSGKMLGIITHVDAVINEFDQRIVAVKKAGGISELEGSGIRKIE